MCARASRLSSRNEKPNSKESKISVSSKLQTEQWAVLSHLGLEAKGLTHEEARRLVHRLASEGRHGLCIVSDEAASRITAPNSTPNSKISPSG